MKQRLFTLLFAIVACVSYALGAPTMPQISTSEQVHWYYIQFTQGGNMVTDQGDGAICKTGTIKASRAQQWKVEGDANEGYTFTNKLGRKLYVDKAVQTSNSTGFFYASTTSESLDKFAIIATPDGNGWLIAPKSNQNIYMNQYQGAGAGKKLALWNNKSDAGSALTFSEAGDAETAIKLIPYPRSLVKGEGTLDVKTLTAITYADEADKALATDFAAQLKLTAGIDLKVEAGNGTHAAGTISLSRDNTLAAEAYTLTANAEGVKITAAAHAGSFYALQTLKQLLPTAYFGKTLAANAAWQVPYVTISDQPALGYRGFMLDVARHFFDKTEVKRILDIMAFYKLNRFHWHLTDDQGWRIEIPKWPKLTEVGAVRSGSFVNAGGSSKFFDDTEYGRGCFFTIDDLKEIVAYAKERNIEIMPEIDLPGHMVAAVASYPELGCHPDQPSEVRIDGGISKDVLNIGKDEVVDFLKDVLDVVADVFPYQYIHLGGDECPTDQWQNNADCLKRVKDNGLTGVNQLQSWLVEELGLWLKEKHGKDIVVWDELLSHWNDANQVKPVVMAWNSIGKSAEAANHGFKSIIVPYQTLYLDFMQVDPNDTRTDELYQGGWGDNWVNSVPEIAEFNPLSSLSGREKFALGVQGNMWTETCNNDTQLEYQLFPRLLALAETGWLPAAEKKSTTDFLLRMQPHGAILDSLNVTYAKHYFFEKELTEAERAVAEAEDILEKSKPGAVGYADEAAHTALRNALAAAKAAPTDEAATTALTAAIATFKAAPITQPTAGKTYQIVSAATYYKQLYNGSTMYESDGQVRFHYTPQVEPEELWQFTPSGEGYVLTSYGTGHKLALGSYNANATISSTTTGTPIRIDKATVAVKDYSYIPGTVTLSAVSGYTPEAEGNVARLFGDCTGYVKSYNEPRLCYAGTWYVVEVTDFKAQLEGLVKKANRILEDGTTGSYNEPTEEALAYLKDQVVTPAQAAIEAGNVTEEAYKQFVAAYEAYLAMPRKQVYDALDEDAVYTINLVYSSWSGYYAKADASNKQVVPAQNPGEDKAFRWHIKKLGEGKAKLINLGTGLAAYVSGFAQDAKVQLGTEAQGTAWLIGYNETEDASGITIGDGTYSWYANPNAFATVLLKPQDWGAAMWTFTKVGTLTGITDATTDSDAPTTYYDLSGRKVKEPVSGIYVTNRGQKVVLK